MLVNARSRGELERNKEQEQKKVTELAEKLKTYKVEIYNCEYLSKRLRAEEEKAEEACYIVHCDILKKFLSK